MRDKDLWARLADHSFRMSDGQTLAAQLAQNTLLDHIKATRAVDEYRRFAYLVQISGQTLAPSPLIDAVWHRHLQDTKVYLDDFCPKVLNRILHHMPGRASAQDDDAYLSTLSAYAKEFALSPPREIWPRPEVLRWGQRVAAATPVFLVIAVVACLFEAWILAATSAGLALGLGLWWSEAGPWKFGKKRNGSGCGSGCSSGGSDAGADGGGCGGGD